VTVRALMRLATVVTSTMTARTPKVATPIATTVGAIESAWCYGCMRPGMRTLYVRSIAIHGFMLTPRGVGCEVCYELVSIMVFIVLMRTLIILIKVPLRNGTL
jgi:hypothetical protein